MISDTSATDKFIPAGTLTQITRLKGIVIPAVIVGALVYGVAFLWHVAGVNTRLKVSDLRFAEVLRGDLIKDLMAQGSTIAANSPTLFSTEAGIIELKAEAGMPVEKNQLLAVIISPELRERLQQENTQLQRLQANFQMLQLQNRQEEFELQKAVDLAGIKLNSVQREKFRSDKLWEKHLISEMNFERIEDSLAQAKLELALAQKNQQLKLDMLKFEESSQQLDIDRQSQYLLSLQRQVDDLQIRSPVQGVIGDVQVKDSQAIYASQPLLSVVDLSEIEIAARVPEDYVEDVYPGLRVEIQFKGDIYSGRVKAVSPEVTHSQVTTRVIFEGRVPDNLRQNQRITLRLLLEERKNTLTLDRGGFFEQFHGSVFRRQGDKLIRVPVTLGAKGFTSVEIIKGLVPGDQVVISNLNVATETNEILLTE